jgi:hypothetical protein
MYLTFNIEKHKTWGEVRAASNHNLRLGNYGNNVDKNLSTNNITLVSSTNPADDIEHIWNDVVKQRKELKMRQMNDRLTVKGVEMIVGASAEFFDGKSPKQIEEFFRDQLDWLKEYYGDRSQIVHAVVHLDEPGAAPHLQVLFAPIVYKLESRANKTVTTAPTFSAHFMVGNRKDFTAARTSQHDALGAKWGLKQGEKYTENTDPEQIKLDKANLKKFKTMKNKLAAEIKEQAKTYHKQKQKNAKIEATREQVLDRKAKEVKAHHAQTKKMIEANQKTNEFIDSIQDVEVLKRMAEQIASDLEDERKHQEVVRELERIQDDLERAKQLTKQLAAPKYTPQKPK